MDGKPLAQSYAILRYCGSLAGLLPTDAFGAAKVDEILYLLAECDILLAPSGKESDPEKKKALRVELAAGPLAIWFGNIEKALQRGGGTWLVGEKLSIADLAAYCRMNSFVRGAYDDIPKDIVNGYPSLVALYDRVEALPKVAEWNAAHA